MNPMLRGCKCSKCGNWHDIIYNVKGKSVCVNCYRKLLGGKEWWKI